MAKTLFLPLFLALAGLTCPFFSSTPFTMRVVDEHTGAAVPGLRVTNEDGMVRHTGAHGELIIWGKASAHHLADRFEIHDERNRFLDLGATLEITPDRHATLKVRRQADR